MAQVNTVTGPIHPDELGITAMHEHVLWGPPGWEYDPDWWFSVPRVFDVCHRDLVDYKSLGGGTIVDCSGIALGRDVEFYAMLGRTSGVHIVPCTGFWAQGGILGYFAARDIDYHEELYVRELTQGMRDTNVKAGAIKVGNSGNAFTPLEEVIHRAAARASKKTGCAVITHGINFARRQVEVFLEEKLDPSRAVISHCDAAYNLDFERDKEFARKGFFVAYDHIGIEHIWSPMPYAMSDDLRADLVKAFIEAGFLKNLVISADVNSFSLGWQRSSPIVQKSGVALLLRSFVPRLRRIGVSEEDIHTMLVETPKRILPF